MVDVFLKVLRFDKILLHAVMKAMSFEHLIVRFASSSCRFKMRLRHASGWCSKSVVCRDSAKNALRSSA